MMVNCESHEAVAEARPYRLYAAIIWLVAIWWLCVGAAIVALQFSLYWGPAIYGCVFALLFRWAVLVYRGGGIRGKRWLIVFPLPLFCGGMAVAGLVTAAIGVNFARLDQKFAGVPEALSAGQSVMHQLRSEMLLTNDRFPERLPDQVRAVRMGRALEWRVVYQGGGAKFAKQWSKRVIFFIRPAIDNRWRVTGFADGRCDTEKVPAPRP